MVKNISLKLYPLQLLRYSKENEYVSSCVVLPAPSLFSFNLPNMKSKTKINLLKNLGDKLFVEHSQC